MNDQGLRIAAALLFGSAIGIERQLHHHEAGLRTNTLVSLGSALYVTLGLAFSGEGAARVAAQVLTGIGFLGGGVIMRDGLHVRGLTTAATLWCTAAIGTLCGAGKYAEAATGTAAILLVNVLVKRLSLRLGEENPPPPAMRCRLSFSSATPPFDLIVDLAKAAGFQLTSYKTNGPILMEFETYNTNAAFDAVLAELRRDPTVGNLSWERID